MRLIGTFDTEKEAYAFYSFLLSQEIQNIYEPATEEKTGAKLYRIWVYDEEDFEPAIEFLNAYKENPLDPKFQPLLPSGTPPSPRYAEISEKEELKWQTVPPVRIKTRKISLTLAHLIILVCGFLFLWNDFQEAQILKEKGPLVVQIAMTPLQKQLLFDYPASYDYIQQMIDTVPLNSVKEMKELPPEAQVFIKQADEAPSWRGIYEFFATAKKKGWEEATSVPMFTKISQGQAWRLFTPCVLHRDFLHILFNMVWVWILVKQIEARIKKWKVCLMILIIGIVSNVVQYLMSGPYFLGFSGVIVGLAGFIWVRQKKAPWEGYPLQRSTLLFLLFFVLSMFAIELLTLSLKLFSVIQLTPSIANTAHIVGGLVGILLGKFSFFGRKLS